MYSRNMARGILCKGAFGLIVIVVKLNLFLAMAELTPVEQRRMWAQITQATSEQWRETVAGVLPFLSEPEDVLRGNKVSEPCRQHWSQMRGDIKSKFYAMSMVDSSAKEPTGMLYGAFMHPGNWEECVKVRDVQAAKNTSFQGQMCSVAFSFTNRAGDPKQRSGTLPSALVGVGFNLGKCVPSSCSADDVAEIYRLPKLVPMEATVDPQTCTTLDRPKWEPVDWVALGVFSCLAAVMALSTAYDVMQRAKSRRPHAVLASFSVYSNGKKLLAMPSTTADATLGCVHGMRFISMMWVVMGHRYMYNMFTPFINPIYAVNLFRDWKNAVISNATLSVDTFFVISGVLVAYVFLKEVRKKGKFNVVMFYVHRYVRLTPALAFVMLFYAGLLRHVGWGPRWTASTEPDIEHCQKNWWSTLLYVNNYVNPSGACVGQSWYLMVDMQLYWVSPLVLVPLWKWPNVGICLVGLLSLGGIISNFVLSYQHKLSVYGFLTEDPDGVDFFNRHTYIGAYCRFVPYLIGIGLGYYIANMQQSGQKPRFPLWARIVLWIAAARLMLGSLFGATLFWQENYHYSAIQVSLYNALGRPTWSLGLAIVILLCATGNGCFVNTILSWWGFQVLGRLSYSVYLVHMGIMLVQVASWRTYTVLGDFITWTQFGGDMFLSLLAAAILSLSCESPFMALEKALLGGGRRPETSVPASSPEIQPKPEDSEEVEKPEKESV